jgi:hypothetical protein
MDEDEDGSVSMGDFLSYMLVNTGKCQRADVDKLVTLFRKLDVAGAGTLDIADLKVDHVDAGADTWSDSEHGDTPATPRIAVRALEGRLAAVAALAGQTATGGEGAGGAGAVGAAAGAAGAAGRGGGSALSARLGGCGGAARVIPPPAARAAPRRALPPPPGARRLSAYLQPGAQAGMEMLPVPGAEALSPPAEVAAMAGGGKRAGEQEGPQEREGEEGGGRGAEQGEPETETETGGGEGSQGQAPAESGRPQQPPANGEDDDEGEDGHFMRDGEIRYAHSRVL